MAWLIIKTVISFLKQGKSHAKENISSIDYLIQ